MSPTKRPFQRTFFAFVANRSMKRMSCGLPQLRLRDGRMTCQVGPVMGSDTAPARQPSKSPPIERGGPGDGVNLRANSSLAGVDSASGFFSGGRGLVLSEPGSIGSIKCFSCARVELAAARKRTTSQTTARISNYSPTGSVGKCNEHSSRRPPFFIPGVGLLWRRRRARYYCVRFGRGGKIFSGRDRGG